MIPKDLISNGTVSVAWIFIFTNRNNVEDMERDCLILCFKLVFYLCCNEFGFFHVVSYLSNVLLQDNNINASSIPIDRPSDKLLKFLMKHYNLRTIIPQANNFILYEQFFTGKIFLFEQQRGRVQVQMKDCPWVVFSFLKSDIKIS